MGVVDTNRYVSTAIAEAQAAAEHAAADPYNESLQQALQQKLQAAENAAQTAARQIDKLAQNPMDIDIDRELAEMLMETGQPAQALAEYERSLKRDANRYRSISGAARALQIGAG